MATMPAGIENVPTKKETAKRLRRANTSTDEEQTEKPEPQPAFEGLIQALEDAHAKLEKQTVKQGNVTLRNDTQASIAWVVKHMKTMEAPNTHRTNPIQTQGIDERFESIEKKLAEISDSIQTGAMQKLRNKLPNKPHLHPTPPGNRLHKKSRKNAKSTTPNSNASEQSWK